MHYVLRLGGNQAKLRYPLPMGDAPEWRCALDDNGQRVFEWSHDLPDIPPDHIIVPSFACRPAETGYQFALHAGEPYELQPVPAHKPQKNNASGAPRAVSTHIDCWHTERNVTAARVTLRVITTATVDDCLLTLTIRPLVATPPVPPAIDVVAAQPEATSQMLAESSIRSRICSPTALYMALSLTSGRPAWSDTVNACYDPATKAYGSWPLAIRWAATNGTLGAVEAVADWSTALRVLQTGTPLVCSIRFAKDQLPGAPLSQTSGHLVLLQGVQRGEALVYDPAAPTNAEVARRYPLARFSEAWLHRRGAAYMFST